jgi:hypothetical protein
MQLIFFSGECPDKSYLYAAAIGMCFKIYTTMWTWQQAQDKCHSEHAALVEPNTVAKIKFFDKFLRTLAIVKGNVFLLISVYYVVMATMNICEPCSLDGHYIQVMFLFSFLKKAFYFCVLL